MRIFCLLPVFLSIIGLSAAADAAHATEMSFRAVQIGACGEKCPTIIAATGEITQNTPGEFQAFVEQSYGGDARHAVVFLDSMGGRVIASMEFGMLLRQIGAAAVVAGVAADASGRAVITNAQCFSACVYAFMGGRRRVVPAQSQIGTHRMFLVEQGLDASGTVLLRRRRFDNGDMRAFLMRYSTEMGVSPALIAQAEHIPSAQLHVLSRAEIKRFHLAAAKL